MLSYQANVNSSLLTSPQPADVSSASILKSVREQEAQFERLARELEAERESVSHRLDKQRPLGPDYSHNSSMNSVSHDESFRWTSPLSSSHPPHHLEDESADTSKMNSNLLDSCLRELEDRGTLNTGYEREEGTMDYMHPEYRDHGGGDSFYSPQAPYGGGGGGVGGDNYANTSFDRGSHASLQSNGSNRPQQNLRPGEGMGSRGGGSLSPYGHLEDSRHSPMPRSGSPTGPPYYQRESPYHNLPPYRDAPSPSGLGPDPHSSYPRHDDSFGSRDEYPGSRNSYNRPGDGYGGQGYNDNYADPPYNSQQPSYRDSPMGDPHSGGGYGDYPNNRDIPSGPPYDDSYRESPYHHQDYNSSGPPLNGRMIDDDRYSDRHNTSLPPRHDDSFQGMRSGDVPGHQSNQPSYDQDGYNSDVGRQRGSYDQTDGPQGQYGGTGEPRYRGSYDHEGPGYGAAPLEESGPRYRGSYDQEPSGYGAAPLDDGAPRYRGSYDHEGPQGQYPDPPTYQDDYDQQGQSYGAPPPQQEEGPRYRGSYGDDTHGMPPPMYDDTPHKFDGLPPVQSDPFADDPFRDQRSQDGSFSALREDPYSRGPEDPYNRSMEDPYNRGPEDPYSRGPEDLYNRGPEDPYSRGPEDPYSRGPEDPYSRGPEDPYSRGPEDPYSRGPEDPYSRGPEDPYSHGPEDPYSRGPEDPYNRGPSPMGGSDIYGDRYYGEYGFGPVVCMKNDARTDEDMARRMYALNVGAPPDDRRTPSIDGRPPVGGYIRPPDLQEVIDYLNYPDDSVKANAAAYLQHLSYNDDGIKAKTRGLDGIRPLIALLSHDLTEVHKNACGALQNLSFGKANDDNKKTIKNEGGIPELIRLLRKTDQEDVMDSVTGILWNLSSCNDLKQAILDDGLTVLVSCVVLPYSGWSSIASQPSQRPWTTVFRNTTGILRNISSAGYEARKKLRECRGLVNALIHTLQMAHDELINCKPVENVVCTLRNLSYRVQEMEDPDFYKKRSLPKGPATQNKGGENAGCFGGSNKKSSKKSGSIRETQPQLAPPNLPPSSTEYRSLWGNDLIQLYLNVLKHSINPASIEAAAGAIQNLTACDWAPAVECRAFIRKAKGLPNLVDLLTNESHRVVCAAATALRNLTIDNTNKELIGKYSIQQLVAWLPKDSRHLANKSPDDLTCAVLATLYEVVRSSQDYAASLIQEDGLSRLKYINTSEGKFLARTLKINHTILKTLWGFKALHPQYARMNFTEEDFTHSRATPRPDSNFRDGTMPSSNHTTPYSTLSRPISAQGYDDNTLATGRLPRHDDRGNYSYHGPNHSDMEGYLPMNRSNPAIYDHNDRMYSRERLPPDSIAMNDIGPGYAPLDEPRPHKKPVGGVPLFPNLPPGAQDSEHSPQQDLNTVPEPLYAQVNKGRRRNDDYARQGSGGLMESGQGGADSWV